MVPSWYLPSKKTLPPLSKRPDIAVYSILTVVKGIFGLLHPRYSIIIISLHPQHRNEVTREV